MIDDFLKFIEFDTSDNERSSGFQSSDTFYLRADFLCFALVSAVAAVLAALMIEKSCAFDAAIAAELVFPVDPLHALLFACCTCSASGTMFAIFF